MTDRAGPGPAARHEARPSNRMIVRGALRITGSATALVAIYYLLPLNHSSAWVAVTILVTGLAVFAALVALQVRSIIRSAFPARGRGHAGEGGRTPTPFGTGS